MDAEGGVAEGPDRGVDDGDDDHDHAEEPLEVLRGLHRRLDRQDQPDALEGEDGGADRQRVVLRVEQDDRLVDALGRDRADVVVVDVREADRDEDVGQQRRGAQLGDVADEGERDQDDQLQEDQRGGREGAAAAADGLEEGQHVLRREDDAGADEADLRERDGAEDQPAHPVPHDQLADVAVAAAVVLLALQQQAERHHRQRRDTEQGDGREENAAVVERLGEKHDAGADEPLQEREEGLGRPRVG